MDISYVLSHYRPVRCMESDSMLGLVDDHKCYFSIGYEIVLTAGANEPHLHHGALGEVQVSLFGRRARTSLAGLSSLLDLGTPFLLQVAQLFELTLCVPMTSGWVVGDPTSGYRFRGGSRSFIFVAYRTVVALRGKYSLLLDDSSSYSSPSGVRSTPSEDRRALGVHPKPSHHIRS